MPGPINPPRELMVDVYACPRCAGGHIAFKMLRFTRLHRIGEFSHWAKCPTTGDPVFLRTTMCSLGICGVQPGGTHSEESHCHGCVESTLSPGVFHQRSINCPVHSNLMRMHGRSMVGWFVDDNAEMTEEVAHAVQS